MFDANQHSSGEREYSLINAEDTGWFVWNITTFTLRDAVDLSAIEWPLGEGEFARAGELLWP